MPNRRGRKATKVSVSASDTGNGMGREIGLVMVAPRRPSLWLCDRSPRPCWPIVAICGQDDAAHSPETKKPLKSKGLNVVGAAGGDRTHDPWLRRQMLYPLSYSRMPDNRQTIRGLLHVPGALRRKGDSVARGSQVAGRAKPRPAR